jgi:hypothetical protein
METRLHPTSCRSGAGKSTAKARTAGAGVLLSTMVTAEDATRMMMTRTAVPATAGQGAGVQFSGGACVKAA